MLELDIINGYVRRCFMIASYFHDNTKFLFRMAQIDFSYVPAVKVRIK